MCDLRGTAGEGGQFFTRGFKRPKKMGEHGKEPLETEQPAGREET